MLRLADGTEHEAVTPVRAFPIAAPQEGLSLVGADGHELAWVPRLADLAAAARTLIEEELAAREFVPTITRIRSVSSFSTPSTWEVDTDRGAAQLVLKGEEDIRRLSGRNCSSPPATGCTFMCPTARRSIAPRASCWSDFCNNFHSISRLSGGRCKAICQ